MDGAPSGALGRFLTSVRAPSATRRPGDLLGLGQAAVQECVQAGSEMTLHGGDDSGAAVRGIWVCQQFGLVPGSCPSTGEQQRVVGEMVVESNREQRRRHLGEVGPSP